MNTDMLRRSMDAEPADWLDRLVIERAVTDMRRQRAPQERRSTAEGASVRRAPRSMLAAALRTWARLLPPALQVLWRGGAQRG